MLEILLDIILFIPRKMYSHFDDYKCMKQELIEKDIIIDNQRKLLERIDYTCDDYMKKNQMLSNQGFHKIKELANTSPND